MQGAGAFLRFHLPAMVGAVVCALLLTAPAEVVAPRNPGLEPLEDPFHGVLGLLLTWLAARSLGRFGLRPLAAGAVVLLYLTALELVQLAVPGRGFEWWDLAFTVLGIALGLALTRRIYSAAREIV